ncbi:MULTISPECIES: hypothetical protein [unclassified Pseudomonas]|uniref:hypothetical protein n=1 Tax=unclassified Pseudomonas TaxID=196821 RepID=UPI002448124B|nr:MULTISPECIES: hypothetical protein [unclassified Pseudomonas]MDH0896713.1 hypothetical protein [Pseudomonas sp. GD03875]MDH1066461.1 hypothetical protein [Pseudomonas sp. GD03985]
MFLTMEHAEIPAGALVKGAHAWRYVECLTTRPWFLVDVLEHDAGYVRPATYLMKDLEGLLELAGAKDQGWEINSVYLVSCGGRSDSEGWTMAKLKQILRVHAGRESSLAYILHPNSTYFESQRVTSHAETSRQVIVTFD